MHTRTALTIGLMALTAAGAAPLELPGGAELAILDGKAEMAEIDPRAADDLRVTVTPPAPCVLTRSFKVRTCELTSLSTIASR